MDYNPFLGQNVFFGLFSLVLPCNCQIIQTLVFTQAKFPLTLPKAVLPLQGL